MDETLKTILIVFASTIGTLIIRYFWSKGPGTDYVVKTEWEASVAARQLRLDALIAEQKIECERRRTSCKGNTDIDCLKKAVLMLVKYSDKIPEDKKDTIMKDMIE